MMRTVFTADDLSEKCLVKKQQRMPCEGTVCSWSVQTGRPILTQAGAQQPHKPGAEEPVGLLREPRLNGQTRAKQSRRHAERPSDD